MEPDPPQLQPVDPLLRQRFVLPLLQQLRVWRDEAAAGARRLPLIGLNGPVGAGKTSLGRQLEVMAPRFGLRLVVASIDDVYLGWPERGERLAGNPFGVSRVPPGSHDLPLLLDALGRWRQTGTLRLPRFDKTLAAGQGDRASWRQQACDALVLEGWLMGCQPLSDCRLTMLLQALPAAAAQAGNPEKLSVLEQQRCNGAPPLQAEEWSWLPRWNRELDAYRPVWQACDGFWLMRPLHWGLPRRWRFQAEARQRRAGGGWLPPESLQRLVRASLCSLPPALYQDPLTQQLAHQAERFTSPDQPVAGTDTNPGDACGGIDASAESWMPSPSSKVPPVQAVAWLDGRRRCRSVWLQPSLSSSASATG